MMTTIASDHVDAGSFKDNRVRKDLAAPEKENSGSQQQHTDIHLSPSFRFAAINKGNTPREISALLGIYTNGETPVFGQNIRGSAPRHRQIVTTPPRQRR
jgi:hypothetical protein